MRTKRLLAGFAIIALPFAALAQGAPRYLAQRDVIEAQRQHAEIVAEFGGAETGARAAYVESVGRRVGAYSGLANSNNVLHYTTLNSAVENAFAVPGGHVYITR
ncbi:MAG: peptidase M48 Ste24p, partial [Sphingomicrobium sp.]